MSFFDCPEPIQLPLPADARHVSGPRSVQSIVSIILHATAGTDSRKWLTTDPASQVSSHVLIDKVGTIYRLVPDSVIANHVGYSRLGNRMNLNPVTLGIELENRNSGTDPYPDAQLDTCVKIVVYWRSLYGDLPLLAHALVDTQGKTDPKGFPWTRFYLKLDQYRVWLEQSSIRAAARQIRDLAQSLLDQS